MVAWVSDAVSASTVLIRRGAAAVWLLCNLGAVESGRPGEGAASSPLNLAQPWEGPRCLGRTDSGCAPGVPTFRPASARAAGEPGAGGGARSMEIMSPVLSKVPSPLTLPLTVARTALGAASSMEDINRAASPTEAPIGRLRTCPPRVATRTPRSRSLRRTERTSRALRSKSTAAAAFRVSSAAAAAATADAGAAAAAVARVLTQPVPMAAAAAARSRIARAPAAAEEALSPATPESNGAAG
mmetsp:Transcript_8747/g.22265  ORF Transcript_8747/g.22265 Transcript_8747/m.22265 type:complete len:242 (+) Transcript_8747:1053-1778(+)